MTPAEELRAAAFQLRNPFHQPGLKVGIDSDLTEPLADWLDHAALSCDAAEVAACRVWSDDAVERDRWIASQSDTPALTVARAINGQPQPIPLANVRELQQAADDEASLISPSERRAQTIGEIGVTVELHCRAAGFPELADELAGVLRQLAVDGSQP